MSSVKAKTKIGGKEADLQVSLWKERYRIFALNVFFFLVPLAVSFLYHFLNEGFLSRDFSRINLSAVWLIAPYCIVQSLFIAVALSFSYVSYRQPQSRKSASSDSLFAEGEKYIRGARVSLKPSNEVLDAVNKDLKKKSIMPVVVAGSPFPYSLENRGMYIQGSAGSGKTQVIRQMIYDIRRRGGRDKLVIYDRKPEFLPVFWRQDDVIICPADKRHTEWDLFAEMRGQEDIDGIIKSLFPDLPSTGANDKFWIDSARGIFKGILVYLLNRADKQNRRATMEDLVLLLNNSISEPKKLKEILWRDETAKFYAAALADADNDRATVPTSAMGTLNTYVSSFMRPEVACRGNFSIKDWLKDENTEGQAIFLANPARYESNYRSYFTCILDLALKEMISLTSDIDRRVWFFIDEFGSLMKLDSIVRLLAEGRSKGACTVLGTQDMAQIKQQYDKEVETILNNCNSKVLGRIASFEEAEYVSKMIGQYEVEKDEDDKVNYSLDSRGASVSMSDGANSSRREKREAVLPNEIQSLADMHYYCQFGNYPFFRNSIPYYPWNSHEIIPEFICRSKEAFDASRIIVDDISSL